jgi:chromosomal replication initiation ATPase DnaA
MTNPFAAITNDKTHKLIEATAELSGLDMEVLCTNREAPVFLARATAMWIMRNHLGMSLGEIGRAFGRDHSTVINALRRADGMIESYSMVRDLKDQLVKQIDEAA